MTDREVLDRIDHRLAQLLASQRTVNARLRTVEETMATQTDIDNLTAQLTQAEADFRFEWGEAIADIQRQASVQGVTLDLSKLQAAADAFTADDSAWKTQLAALPAAPAPAS